MNQTERRQQRRQWAITGDKQKGHELFKLCNRKVCSAAICQLIGFSNSTWKEAKLSREDELYLERDHGNKVRL